ncbi:charged multivesicular body protein 3-like [Oppia nitens]|uniref:charged multivesicular body protein 3-like n=1 Tax=Oppia nitens TaxID=1686743 RepID=UPI0023DA2333|nr:charged multivesicular body protein 3-like [Oppia nitens]
MGLFGKDPSKSPKEQVREWTSKLRKQQFLLDRQIRGIQREEEKVKLELKKAAKRGDKDVCLVLAKEIVNSRKAINRIHTSKAQLNSVMMNMTQQLSTLRVANAMEKSGAVMKSMQQLVRVQEISHVMQEMSREMMKAGIIEEMLEETLDDQLERDDNLEEEAQKEVDKVLWDLTAGQLGGAPAAVSDTLPTIGEPSTKVQASSVSPLADDDDDISEMQQRLQALRS